jgi:hypothetical protein
MQVSPRRATGGVFDCGEGLSLEEVHGARVGHGISGTGKSSAIHNRDHVKDDALFRKCMSRISRGEPGQWRMSPGYFHITLP